MKIMFTALNYIAKSFYWECILVIKFILRSDGLNKTNITACWFININRRKLLNLAKVSMLEDGAWEFFLFDEHLLADFTISWDNNVLSFIWRGCWLFDNIWLIFKVVERLGRDWWFVYFIDNMSKVFLGVNKKQCIFGKRDCLFSFSHK